MTPTDADQVDLIRALESWTDPARLRSDVEALAATPRSRLRAPDGIERAERHVAVELDRAGWTVDRQPFEARWQLGCTDRAGRLPPPFNLRLHRRLHGANLIADRPSHSTHLAADRPGPRPTVVVGAHLDTVDGSPGADDNASGVAVVLEIARLLARLPDPPAVTLAVFDLEELGLIGARVAARSLTRSRDVAGMICVESVGYFTTGPDTQRLPPGAGLVLGDAVRTVRARGFRGDFTLVAHRRSSRAAALRWQQAAAATGCALPCVLARDPRPDGIVGALIGLAVPPAGNLGRSDHSPFWNRRIPALMLTGTANFRNPHYHRPTDTPDRLDYRRLAAVAVATAATAVHWPR